MRQIGSPSTSTRIIDSFGSSLVEATRSRVTLHAGNPATLTSVNPGGQFLLDRLSDLGNGESVEDLATEPLDQHALGDGMRNAATLEIEEVLRVNRAHRRTVAAAQDVVVQDLEDRLRGCLRLLREEQVAVGLVRGTATRLRLDPNHPDVNALGPIAQRSLEQQVRGGMRSDVILQRPKIKGLVAGAKEQAPEIGARARPFQNRLDPHPRHLTAERDVHDVQMRIAAELEALISELPGLDAPVLQGDIPGIGAFL